MITALDHVVLICPDIDIGADMYQTLLGAPPAWRTEDDEDGSASAIFKLKNTAIELLAPSGNGPVGKRLKALLGENGPHLTSLAFASDDLVSDHRLIGRRGLVPDDMADGTSTDLISGQTRTWRRFRCDDAACAGIKTFVLQPVTGALDPSPPEPGVAHGLDHIVITTPNPDRAVAHYGARLGLRFALDRSVEDWKTRFLFFRTGGLTLEVIHRLGEASALQDPDRFWGLTWSTDNLEVAHERLSKAGLDISEIRTGRKPGSTVFTVRNGSLEVPTLFISHAPA
ncbi:MAG: VOC family protein [Pseudomonadota bacterium]